MAILQKAKIFVGDIWVETRISVSDYAFIFSEEFSFTIKIIMQ